jgi:putative membrane protein
MPWRPKAFLIRCTAGIADATTAAASGVVRSGNAAARTAIRATETVRHFRPFRGKPPESGAGAVPNELLPPIRRSRRNRIDERSSAGSGAVRWLVLSALALASYFIIRTIDWIVEVFGRSPELGIAAAIAVLTAIGAAIAAVRAEVGSIARLKAHVEIHDAFGTPDDRPLSPDALKSLREWLCSLPQEADSPPIEIRIASASEVADLIEEQFLRAMDRAAVDRIRLGVLHAFGLIALSPTPITDTALFAWRAMRLVREIAEIYGLRPSAIGAFWLLRQIIMDAALIATADLAADAIATILGDKIVAKLSSPLAEGSVASYRMARFGLLAIERCRPVPFRETDQLGLFTVLKRDQNLSRK